MNTLEFDAALLDHVTDDRLRATILNVLTTMEEQLQLGLNVSLLCVLAHQDDVTDTPLDTPRTVMTLIHTAEIVQHPARTFAFIRKTADRTKASFSIFASQAYVPVTVNQAAWMAPAVVLFIQHATMVEDHWYVIALIKADETSRELVNLTFVKAEEADAASPVAGLQMIAQPSKSSKSTPSTPTKPTDQLN